jgi:hypothetical protein
MSTAGMSTAGSSADVGSCLRPPTAAAIVDPFRPPPCPWCPGNRGIEYATRPGDALEAVAPGRVVFAGAVAGVLYVTVRHVAGRTLRSTYGRLESLAVRVGDEVIAGDPVGRTGGSAIVTVRDADGSYLDPGPLFGTATWRARLVPIDGTPPRPPLPGPTVCPGQVSGGGSTG